VGESVKYKVDLDKSEWDSSRSKISILENAGREKHTKAFTEIKY